MRAGRNRNTDGSCRFKEWKNYEKNDSIDHRRRAAAITVIRMGAMPSLPTITEVQELLRKRSYEDFDLSFLDVLHRT